MEKKAALFIKRAEKPDDKGKRQYDGILYRLPFKTDTVIWISGLTFFGLHKDNKHKLKSAEYIISVTVRDSLSCNPSMGLDDIEVFMPLQKYRATLKVDTKYELDFNYPVRVPSYHWVEIAYELDGPVTQIMKESDANVSRLLSTGGVVKFEFSGRSTRQIAEIRFHLEP